MAYDAQERFTLPAQNDYTIYVPAVVREADVLGYNDGVRVTLYPEEDFVESIDFKAYITAGQTITIPSEIRDRFDIDGTVEVSFEATHERWTPEVDASARKGVYESAHPEETELKAVTDIAADD